MFIRKYQYDNILKAVAITQRDLANLQTELKILDKNTHKWVDEIKNRILELERIVKNQPLIKKYQKTLDIFLKNAQD